MENITLDPFKDGQQIFILREKGEKLGEMVMKVAGGTMTVYHTEVAPEAEGKGVARELLTVLTEYARQHQLTVNPLCSYVLAQFRKHPQLYADIWQKSE